MAGGVLCPKCGTVSATETKTCPKCGTALGMDGATSKSRTFKPPVRAAATPTARRAAPEAMTAPDDTMAEDEQQARVPAPRKPKATAAGPVPQAGPAPRRSNAGRGGDGPRDALIGKKLQEYVIEERLGVGGMGVVYKATHGLIGKSVAIKVLRPDIVQDPRDMSRLLDEARIISAIKNRGIINIFGAGALEDGRNYLIMELLEGESLEQLMQREGRIPAGDAVVILEQVLSALYAAHEAGVVHRDLKPANVFLVTEGNLTYVKLLDFGLARRSQQEVTRIAGTPDYISPEHARGRPAGPPADLYAFGVLCFHMLTGQLPFIGNTPMEVMEKHVHSPPPVPHELNKAIPKALSELILKLLAKDPGERPDAAQVKADLRAATKQMRTAPTMMSLVSVEPVREAAAILEERKHAQKLAAKAQVADIKRKVTRRWPWVLGAAIAVWFIGVLAYVMWPSKPPVVVPSKPPPLSKVHKNPMLDPAPDPVKPVVVAEPPKVEPVKPVEAPPPGTPQVEPEVVPTEPVAVEEVDAGEEELVEDRNAPLDDVRIGEFKRQKRIDVTLDDMGLIMKEDRDRRDFFEQPYLRTKKLCDEAATLSKLADCQDELERLSTRFYKN